jgi:cycloeucalenol cycloisomerase
VIAATERVPSSTAAARGGRWLSANPDKAWGEKFFLAYSPLWMAAFGIYQRTRLVDALGDAGNLLVTLAIFLPVWLVPLLLHDAAAAGRRWYQSYWFKFNVWILIYSAIGSYFLSEYFFDVLGMVYNYPQLHWTFDSVMLGSGRQVVPVVMYLHAHYFFVTYHTTAVVVMRRVRTSRLNVHPLVGALVVALAAWFWARAEITLTTSPSIADQFRYEDLQWALRWGALFYASYFVVSFPMVYRLDERADDVWSVGRTVVDALAAGMLTFVLLDLATRVTGMPYR